MQYGTRGLLKIDSKHFIQGAKMSTFYQDRSNVKKTYLLLVGKDTIVALLEPVHGLLLVDAVVGTNLGDGTATLGDAVTGAVHADEEVHTVNTDGGIVLDTQIDVLLDTEAEVAGLGEVGLLQLVLLDLEATLENLLGLGATDGNVDGDLLVTTDTEGTDGVAGLGVDGGLTGQLLQNLGGTGESVSGLSNANVENELLEAQLAHGVGGLLGLVFGGLVAVTGGAYDKI